VQSVEEEVKRKLGFTIRFDEKLMQAPPLEKLLKIKKPRKMKPKKLNTKVFWREAKEFFQTV
jgi:hypothetical protein